MKNKFLICSIIALIFCGIKGKADTIEDVDFYEAGGNYYNYPWLEKNPPAQILPPEGYKPFHLEHYGRHGSRWLIGDYSYDTAFELLGKAHNAGKLTPLGEEIYLTVADVRNEFKKGRDGELSDKGAWQHQGIGERMVENYPEIFNSETQVDARSTTVIRSILSMFNGLNGIQSLVPDIKIKTDASNADMWYMNYHDPKMWSLKERADSLYLEPFKQKHSNKGEYFKKLFNDQDYARDSIGDRLFNSLYSVLVNTQSHSDQPWLIEEVFTEEEVRDRWLIRNANWFLQCGNSVLTENHQPFTQRNVLLNIIESADSAINSNRRSVNLRYGHDSIIMPLSCLMELNSFGEEINDLEELAERGWHDYQAIPMGANIQIVFYRKENEPASDDVLVKVLLNEVEAELPLDNSLAPYYSWKDFKDYYKSKLN